MDADSIQQNDEMIRNDVHAASNDQRATICDLNDDCLECIFERVTDIKDQIQMAKCTRRFHDTLVRMWRRQPHHRIFTFNVIHKLFADHNDLEYYLTAMREEFHTLRIFDESINAFVKEMDNCNIQCFPGVERCECHDYLTNCHPSDSDMEAVSNLMPNLKYFQILVPITGKHLMNFQYLEELLIYDEQTKEREIEQENLRDILLNLKHLRVLDIRTYEVSLLRLTPEISQCTTLEVLKLNLNTLKPMLNEVMQLPQLKQLTVLLDQCINTAVIGNVDNYDFRIYETEEFHRILQLKGPQIQGIAVDFCYLPISAKWSEWFCYLLPENLKLLAFCNTQFNVDEFNECDFTHLETLCLRHTEHLQALDIIKMLHLCPVLKHLDISFCLDLPISLLTDILKFLQNEHRQQVLCLYCHRSGLDNEIKKNVAFWNAQKNLKLCKDFPPDSEIGLSYIQRGYTFYF